MDPAQKPAWERSLERALTRPGRVVVIGVGNADRGDDAAGIRCAERLAERVPDGADGRARIVVAGPAPENYTGVIRAIAPALVLVIDSAAMGLAPGEIGLVDPNRIAEDDVTTHRVPLSQLKRYLENDIGTKVLILGIEPKATELRAPLSQEVAAAVDAVVRTLARLLS